MFNPEKTPTTHAQEIINSLEQGLEEVDFAVLGDIFTKILIKSGVEKERLEKVSEEVINKIEKGNLLSLFNTDTAAYSSDEDKIIFLRSLALPKFQEFVSILVHELVHMVSDISKGENTTTENYKSRVGLDKQQYGGKFLRVLPFYENSNMLLNEGITQLLTEAIIHEYFRRKGEKVKDIRNEDRNVYLSGKAIVELLTKSISYRSGVSEEIAFQSLVRSMLNYDYDDFISLLGDDDTLRGLVEKIQGLDQRDLEKIAVLGRFGIGERSVVLDSIRVEGLEAVFDTILNGRARKNPKKETMDETYFNPFYKNLD
jgi:hypothetical protein